MSHIHRTIGRRIGDLLTGDRIALTRELKRLESLEQKDTDHRLFEEKLLSLQKRILRAEKRKEVRLRQSPSVTYPEELPIVSQRDEIITAINRNQVIVVTGATGSGKTTQIPKMCLEAGRGINGIIGCTQPRRIAAVSIARRLAEELGEEPGRSVGHKIRFEDLTDPRGYIKFMTDGILLMEAQSDSLLRQYDTLIIDEAHERSTTIDFILGMLRNLVKKRRDIKIIITSATIDPEKFSRTFDNAPMIEVSGRTWPVEIRYRPIYPDGNEDGVQGYLEAALDAVEELKRERRRGHILIFMPTEQDIRDACEALRGRDYRDTVVMPLFARLPSGDQQRVFQNTRQDKIIVSTNVAETSITVPGIRYVIDTGLARIAEYRPQTRTRGLPVKAISRSSAVQRTGRCGRVESGICIRLFSEDDFENRPLYTPPEILRTSLAEVILRMMNLGLGNIEAFPFIDPPSPRAIRDGYAILLELGAIRPDGAGYVLTDRGRQMARLPLDPRIARIILEARREGCLKEILIIAAALSMQDPRERPTEHEREADMAHKTFINPSSDFLTLLSLWHAFHGAPASPATEREKRTFCRSHYLSCRRMREWRSVREELEAILKDTGLKTTAPKHPLSGEALDKAIHTSILAGYLSQIAMKKEKNLYRFPRGREAMLFPGSGCFNRGGTWIVSAEMIETSRLFARINGTVKSEWLEEAGSEFCRRTWANPQWDAERGEVTATEQVSLFGLIIVPARTVSYGPVNPNEATEVFIREALLGDGLSSPPAFLKHNRALIDGIITMENKLRKRTILVDDEELADFYRQRLGHIFDSRTLHKIIRDKGSDGFLRMREADIRRWLPKDELEYYPDHISLGGERFSLTYRFAPGSHEDGVTLSIPGHLMDRVTVESPDWKIPGLLREKIQSLIKGLPKNYRRQLIPLGKTIDAVMKDMTGTEEGSLLQILAATIQKRYGLIIPATAWPLDRLPEHLKIRYALTGHKNKELKASRNIGDLVREPLREEADRDFEEVRRMWERNDLTRWNCGDLPDKIVFGDGRKKRGQAFPAITKDDGSVHLRLFRNRDEACRAHRKGINRLYEIQFSKDLKYLKKCLTMPDDIKKIILRTGGARAFDDLLVESLLEKLLDGTVRTEAAFLEQAERARKRIYEESAKVMAMVEPLLKLYGDTHLHLQDRAAANRTNTQVVAFMESLMKRLDCLVPHDFIKRYDEERLSRLPVYIRALRIRADRGISHLDKDAAKARKLLPFITALEELRTTLPPFSSLEKHHALDEFSWMIEEYALSIFAPEVKTALPVSPRRLEHKLEAIRGMI